MPAHAAVSRQGIALTWDIVAIMTVYLVQGALGLARLATTFFFKDELHLAPAEAAALSGLFTLPWVFKPLYGFVSDGLPIFGYRRYIQRRCIVVWKYRAKGCRTHISAHQVTGRCQPVRQPTLSSVALTVVSASSEIPP